MTSRKPPHINTYDDDDDTVIIDICYSQVQPDVEELTQNMEDNEDADSKKVKFKIWAN